MIYCRQKWFPPPFTTSTLFMLWKGDDIMATVNDVICRQNEQTLSMKKELEDKINLISRADYGIINNTPAFEKAMTLLIERAVLLECLVQNAKAIQGLNNPAR